MGSRLLRVQLCLSWRPTCFSSVIPSSASLGCRLAVALGHLISGASRFVKSVHILEVFRTRNICPVGGGGEDCLLGD